MCISLIGVDVSAERIALINSGRSPIEDMEIENFLASGGCRLEATADHGAAYAGADYVIVATPRDYDLVTNKLNTESVEAVVRQVQQVNSGALIVVTSTVLVGFTERIRRECECDVVFSPEFLRERQGPLRQPASVTHRGGRAV